MLNEILTWINSNENIFKKHGENFEILQTEDKIKNYGCVTLDFEFQDYYCRFIFWKEGNGHIEVVDIEKEITFIDESIDWFSELNKDEPFFNIYEKIFASLS